MSATGGTARSDRARIGSADTEGLPSPRRYVAVAALSLGTVLTTVDGTIVNVALPTLARDLHVTSSAAVLVVTVYQLVLIMTLLPFASLGDRLGHRATYQYGQMIFVAATVLCFFARSLPLLVVARGFQALGAAAALSVTSAMIRSTYPLRQLGRGMSFNTAIAATSASLAPTVGGAVLGFAGWPWLFALVVPFGILSILVGQKALPGTKPTSGPFDIIAAIMCAATFGLGVSGLEVAVEGGPLALAATLVGLGITLGIVFVRREAGRTRPIFPVDLLRMRSVALPAAGSLACYLALTIITVTLPFRLQQQLHFSPVAAGAELAPFPLLSLLVAPASGFFSDRLPAGLLGSIGMAICVIGMMLLVFLPAYPGHIDIAWRVTICAFGFAMFFSPNARQILASAPIHRAAAAGSLVPTVRGTGQTLGATAVAALLACGAGMNAIPPLIGAGLCFLGGAFSITALMARKA